LIALTSQPVFILLIADNFANARQVSAALQSYYSDCHVEIVQDGPTALDCLFHTGRYAHHPVQRVVDLILIDVRLSSMPTLQVLKAIEFYVRTKAIPIVVLVATPEEQQQIEQYELRVTNFLPKSTGSDLLAKQIQIFATPANSTSAETE
jgi:CheY-like chemotaxis protein